MLIVLNENLSTAFNLAAEEYMLRHFEEDVFMLWRGKPSVLIGKYQNALAEINVDYVNEYDIPVVRRITGGGAVFCDLGNTNFTFIVNEAEGSFINFQKFTQPIVDVLLKLSVKAEFSGRNDILIEGKKFSGNAQYRTKKRLLHHGTLLFSSEMTDLSKSLNPRDIKYKSKGVDSVASRVTNISSHLHEQMDIVEFKALIYKHIGETNPEASFYEFTDLDITEINKLVDEKYGSWAWNFGQSPKYSFSNAAKYSGGLLEMNFDVHGGIVDGLKIYGDFFGQRELVDIEKALCGVKHEKEAIQEVLSGFNLNDYFAGITEDEFLALLF